jgi:hypothetical protein
MTTGSQRRFGEAAGNGFDTIALMADVTRAERAFQSAYPQRVHRDF